MFTKDRHSYLKLFIYIFIMTIIINSHFILLYNSIIIIIMRIFVYFLFFSDRVELGEVQVCCSGGNWRAERRGSEVRFGEGYIYIYRKRVGEKGGWRILLKCGK